MRMLTSCVVLIFVLATVVPPVHAQSAHAAPPSALEAAVQQHVASTDANREMVLQLLTRPEIQAVAGKAGIDLRRAEGIVTTLDGSALSEVAAQARQVEQALAGGQSSITLSTTMIIIGLLVLILLIIVLN